MPLTNGDVGVSGTQFALCDQVLDHTTALEFMENEYKHNDGLDVHTLLDSRTRGGLTYNDFLLLPGYIGTLVVSPASCTRLLMASSRLPRLRCCS